jgi:Delta14-sterol reductase
MSSSSKVSSSLNPRTKSYEFLGPPGALLITLGVPVATYALYFGCSESSGGCPPPLSANHILKSLSDVNTWKRLWDTEAALIYLSWYAFCVLAWFLLPGDWVEGVKLRNGNRIKYKINGIPYDSYHVLSLICSTTSLLYLPSGLGAFLRIYPTLWTPVFHLPLR